MGDAGPTIAHSGKALLRQMVSKSPKPMVPQSSWCLMFDEVSLFAMKRGGTTQPNQRGYAARRQAVKESVIFSE